MIDLVLAECAPDDKSKNVDHVCLGIEASETSAIAHYLKEKSVELPGRAGDPLMGARDGTFDSSRSGRQRDRTQADACCRSEAAMMPSADSTGRFSRPDPNQLFS